MQKSMNKIKVNPNKEIASMARDAIEKNRGYCPCKTQHSTDTKCMCKEFKEFYINGGVGVCECGLYIAYSTHPIVCLCGSTKFKDEFYKVARDLTLKGKIVVMPFVFGHSGDECTEEQKKELDALHFSKIDMADSVFVINVNGYIGESTQREIEYAQLIGKPIEYLENKGENE